MNYYDFLSQPKFFHFLTEIDKDLAEIARACGCSRCGGKLDTSDFRRGGFGLPAEAGEGTLLRFSFCCREDGCRKRMTPDSLRFLYRKAYAAAVVVLLAVITNGDDAKRATALARAVRVDRSTLRRWRKWWREDVAASAYWLSRRGDLPPELTSPLPQRLVEAFERRAAARREALENLLAFVAPWRPQGALFCGR